MSQLKPISLFNNTIFIASSVYRRVAWLWGRRSTSWVIT